MINSKGPMRVAEVDGYHVYLNYQCEMSQRFRKSSHCFSEKSFLGK